MSFKPIDVKRDEFRKYLERSGVLDAMSKAFTKLVQLEDKPENPIQFMCENMGATLEYIDNTQRLEQELEEAKAEIAELKKVIETLRAEKTQNEPAALVNNENKEALVKSEPSELVDQKNQNENDEMTNDASAKSGQNDNDKSQKESELKAKPEAEGKN